MEVGDWLLLKLRRPPSNSGDGKETGHVAGVLADNTIEWPMDMEDVLQVNFVPCHKVV